MCLPYFGPIWSPSIAVIESLPILPSHPIGIRSAQYINARPQQSKQLNSANPPITQSQFIQCQLSVGSQCYNQHEKKARPTCTSPSKGKVWPSQCCLWPGTVTSCWLTPTCCPGTQQRHSQVPEDTAFGLHLITLSNENMSSEKLWVNKLHLQIRENLLLDPMPNAAQLGGELENWWL